MERLRHSKYLGLNVLRQDLADILFGSVSFLPFDP